MEYTLRELKASDLGTVCRIIDVIGIKEFKESFKVDNIENASAEKVGLEVIFGMGGVIIQNMPRAQDYIDNFLASLTGLECTQIKDMGFGEYTDLIIEVISKEEFKDFFGRVWKLLNR